VPRAKISTRVYVSVIDEKTLDILKDLYSLFMPFRCPLSRQPSRILFHNIKSQLYLEFTSENMPA